MIFGAPIAGRGAEARLPAVDGLRALAAFSVLAYHVALACGLVTHGPLAPAAAELKAGVAVFFVISGFVLYLPYARALAAGRSLPDWREHIRRRVVRILPGYWLALTACAVAIPSALVLTPNVWRYYLLTQIYEPGTVLGGLGVAWSLCVEMSFYVTLPALAWAMARLVRGAPARGVATRQLGALGVLGGASLAARWLYAGRPAASIPHGGFVVMTALPGFLDWFALGMALAIAVAGADIDGWAGGWWRSGRQRPGLCWMLSAALFALAAVVQPKDIFLSLYGPVAHLLLGTASALLLLPLATGANPLARVFARGPVVWLGTVSYGIYLWHVLVLGVLVGAPVHVPPTSAAAGRVLWLLVAVSAGAVLCGAVSWYAVERPCKRRLTRRGPRLAVAPSAA